MRNLVSKFALLLSTADLADAIEPLQQNAIRLLSASTTSAALALSFVEFCAGFEVFYATGCNVYAALPCVEVELRASGTNGKSFDLPLMALVSHDIEAEIKQLRVRLAVSL